MSTNHVIPSGFDAIDEHLGGGYKGGNLFIARIWEIEPDALQDFIVMQVKQLATSRKVKVLVVSLGMDSKEFVKCLAFDSTPGQLKAIAEAPLFISEFKEKKHNPESVMKDLPGYIDEGDFDIVIIDGAEKLITERNLKVGTLNTETVDALLSLARKSSVPIVVSDYGNKLETGLHRDDRITEMEIKTDVHGTVQASILSNEKKTVTEDLFGLWKVFEGIFKTN